MYMPSIVFVHGTSVRYDGYAKTFAMLKERLLGRRPDVSVVPCSWGDLLGSPPLDDHSLIPRKRPEKPTHRKTAGERETERAEGRRAILDLEPYAELRQLALLWSERAANVSSFGGKTATTRLRERVQVMSADPGLLV
jgi:hypothetical protein